MRFVPVSMALVLAMAGCGDEPQSIEPLVKTEAPKTAKVSAGGIVPENCTVAAPFVRLLRPLGRGPLRLVAIKCSNPVDAQRRTDANLVSPDMRSVALLGGRPEMILTFQRITGGEDVGITVPAAAPNFGHSFNGGVAPIAWSRDSAFLWGVVQPPGRDNGLRPARFHPDGRAVLLPPLTHAAGPLYDLLWTDGDGLALAAFGVNSGINRPPPTFAFVDARRGRILDTLAGGTLPLPRAFPLFSVRAAAVTVLPDGRLRAALASRDLIVWTQGEPPRHFVNPFGGTRTPLMRFTPDGTGLLAVRSLSTGALICEQWSRCPPGRPAEGVLVALHDLRTGATRWAIRARVVVDQEFPMPAISPDGRLALIGLAADAPGHPRLALISMRDGRILQRLPGPGVPWFGSPPSIGFSGNGAFWVRSAYLTALYRIGEPS